MVEALSKGARMRRLLLTIAMTVLPWAVAAFFTGFQLVHGVATVVFLLLVSFVFSVLGLLAALWAEKFEQINFFPTFVMMPLTCLGGVFYSVNLLPEPWHTVSLFNPMVYMVEGIRYGMLGRSGFPPGPGAALLTALALVATAFTAFLFRVGYKLKS